MEVVSKYDQVQRKIYEAKLAKGFLYADGILQHIISKKEKDGLEIFKVRSIGSQNLSYAVKRGWTLSHGKTIKEAITDLQYKVSNRDTSAYTEWKLSTKASKEDMISAYIKITGACSFGVKQFVESKNLEDKEYTIKEVIEITEGSYGNEKFAEFFSSNQSH